MPTNEIARTAVRAITRLAKVCELAARDADLTLAQHRLLTYLAEGSSPASELAERLIVTRPNVTAMVDVLVERGFVRREPDPDDRRRINHALTAEGRKVLAAADLALAERLETTAAHLGTDAATRAIEGVAAFDSALDLALAERVAEQTAKETATA